MELLYKSISKNEYDEVRELLSQDIETSEEFLWALENEPKTLTVVYMEGKIVAVARIIPGGKVSCLIVFVAPKYRCKGIGQAVVQHCEDELHKESGKIMTNFHGDNEVAKRFAKRLGYERQFSSACMKHTEGKFEIGKLPVGYIVMKTICKVILYMHKHFMKCVLKWETFQILLLNNPVKKIGKGGIQMQLTVLHTRKMVRLLHMGI